MDSNVYIVDTATILPPQYQPETVMHRIYKQPGIAESVAIMAKKVSRYTGIERLASVLNLDVFPSKQLISDEHTPKNWCCSLIDAVTTKLPISEIGFLGISYNISSHIDILPNLACQVALEKKLDLVAAPEELAYYGCASGILQLKSAVEFCRRTNKAALVIVLEQCTWTYKPIYDRDDKDFRSSLRAHTLFSDGAAAVLVVPELLSSSFPTKLKIVDFNTGFQLGDAITMRRGHFLVGDDIQELMPKLVASECIEPLLAKHALAPADIREWAIHQGGLPVLMKFKDSSVLGLSDAQLADSADSFTDFGNLSSASCFFTLDRQFKRSSNGELRGMVVAFGAGYYFGCLLYERHG